MIADLPGRPASPELIAGLASALEGSGRLIVVGASDGPRHSGAVHTTTTSTTLAAARNAALDTLVTEPFVVFVGADAAPAFGWLDAALEVLRDHDTVSAVAVGVQGRGRPAMSLLALPEDGGPGSGTSVGFGWPEAVVCRTSPLRHVGGFGEHLGDVGACVELGWRLWLAGGCLRWMPSPAVELDRAPAASPTEVGADALATLFVCYDERRMAAALPAALMALPSLLGAEAAAAAIDRFEKALPELRARRAMVQATRRRADHEMLGLLASASTTEILGDRWDCIATGFDFDQLFGSRRKVLVVTTDVLAAKMAGPAIRAWQIAEALALDHEVRLATTSSRSQLHPEHFVVQSADLIGMAELEQWCDVVILQGYALAQIPALQSSRKVMVVDIYDPLHLESLEMTKRDLEPNRSANVSGTVDILSRQLARGDFFVCASNKQRDLWIGHLSALGRINPANYDEDPTLRRLIDVVPFGLPDHPAEHTRSAIKGVVPGIEEGDEVILWGGGIYNWFDPLTLIHAIDQLRRDRPRVRLYFLGGRHPNPEVVEMRTAVAAHALADRLGLTNRYIFFNEGWVDYEDRQNYLAEANIGVSTHLDHAETAYSFRTRILDYLWAGLPIVATAGDAFANLITAEGLGLVVPAEDPEALAIALGTILADEELAGTCRRNLARVRERFTWTAAVEPLVRFCRTPRRAPDLVAIPLPSPPGELPTPGLRQDLRIVRHLYHEGGPRLVLGAATGRFRRRTPSPPT